MKIYSYVSLLNESGNPYLEKKEQYNVDGRKVYRTPNDLVEFIENSIGIHKCADEYVYILCLDQAGHLIGCFENGHGTVNGSLVSPREIFQKALMIGAVSIVMTHNHPGNNTAPSSMDLDITKRVKEAGKLLGVSLLDHIIVCRDGWCSLREFNYINFEK